MAPITAFGGALDQIRVAAALPATSFARFRRAGAARLPPWRRALQARTFGEIVVAAASAIRARGHPRRQVRSAPAPGYASRLCAALDHRKAVHPGNSPIDDHGVGPRRAGLVEAVDAVGRPFDLKTAIGQLGCDFLSRLAVILDQPALLSSVEFACGENRRRA